MSRRCLPLLSHWACRGFAVEVDGAQVYFRIQEDHDRARGVPRVFTSGVHRCYSVLLCGSDRVHTARIYPRLGHTLLTHLPKDCHLSPMCSYVPHVRDSVVKGYFLKDHSETSSSTEQLLRDLLESDPLMVCSYQRAEDGPGWTQHLWSSVEDKKEQGLYYVVPSDEPQQHLSLYGIYNTDVFYSYEEALKVLQECADIIPEATSVLELLPNRATATNKTDFPVVVVEGLDATGKTTLTESLKDSLGATLLRSPPHCLSPWRARFDQEPPLIRRAFYALGNYITAQQIEQEAVNAPVIVDRFWHSTASYAMATAVSGPVSNLPEEGSELYRWPSDLLQPTLVVVLTLDPEERKRRLGVRGQGKTEEEKELDHNRLFRLRVEEAYRRISGPACITVDASPSADQVLQQVLLLIRAKCHL